MCAFQNLRLFKSRTGFSTQQIFSQVTKTDENWLLQEQLLFLSFYRWSLEGPQSPAIWKTETKGRGAGFMQPGRSEHHAKQLQGVIINFFPTPIARLTMHSALCEQEYLWKLTSISIEILSHPLSGLLLLFQIERYRNKRANDYLAQIRSRKFLDQYEKIYARLFLPRYCFGLVYAVFKGNYQKPL